MKGFPYIITEEGKGDRLQYLEEREKRYDEPWLQELLRKHPDILPISEIEAILYPMIPIGYEVTVDSGSIDILFISQRGYLTIVETKLWRNPQAKREVLAQVIDYASSIAKWNYDKLDEVTRDYLKKYENKDMGLVEWVESNLGPLEEEKDYFEDTISRNLNLGRYWLLIVGDKIHDSLVRMLSYVNKYPGLALNAALVEIQCFQIEAGKKWPLLIIPRVFAYSEIIERSIVQVTVIQGKPAQISVEQEKADLEHTKKRVNLTEEAFWELLKENAASEWEIIREVTNYFKDKPGIDAVPLYNGLKICITLSETGYSLTLFYIKTNGRFQIMPQIVNKRLSETGYDKKIAEDYENKMRFICKTPPNQTEPTGRFTEIDLERFKSTADEVIHQIRAKEG